MNRSPSHHFGLKLRLTLWMVILKSADLAQATKCPSTLFLTFVSMFQHLSLLLPPQRWYPFHFLHIKFHVSLIRGRG